VNELPLTLKKYLERFRSYWDHPAARPQVRSEFQRVINCRELTLGAEVFTSCNGEQLVLPHTCKSRSCPGCGMKATLDWQEGFAARLPDIPFAGIVLTMQSDFWRIFQLNRHLLDDLPALGAGVLQDFARLKYGVEVMITVVRHTFGSRLEFNSHLHILVSTVGVNKKGTRIVRNLKFYRDSIMRLWRQTLIDYLRAALENGQINGPFSQAALETLFDSNYDVWWSVHIDYLWSKRRFIDYISRYLLRPPLAQHKLRQSDDDSVAFETYDKKMQTNVVVEMSACEFISRISSQVQDRYRHTARHFGLLAPRSNATLYEIFFRLLRQRRRPRPARIGWAERIRRTLKRDPLLDSQGQRMYWSGRLKPILENRA